MKKVGDKIKAPNGEWYTIARIHLNGEWTDYELRNELGESGTIREPTPKRKRFKERFKE